MDQQPLRWKVNVEEDDIFIAEVHEIFIQQCEVEKKQFLLNDTIKHGLSVETYETSFSGGFPNIAVSDLKVFFANGLIQ